MPPRAADTWPATSIWMREPFTVSRTVTRELPLRLGDAPLWITNDGSAGVVVTSAGVPGSAPGRTRISISPWFTTSGTRGDSLPGGVVLGGGERLVVAGRLLVDDRLVGADAARIGDDGAGDAAHAPARERARHRVEIAAAHRRVAAAAQVDVADDDAVCRRGAGRTARCGTASRRPAASAPSSSPAPSGSRPDPSARRRAGRVEQPPAARVHHPHADPRPSQHAAVHDLAQRRLQAHDAIVVAIVGAAARARCRRRAVVLRARGCAVLRRGPGAATRRQRRHAPATRRRRATTAEPSSPRAPEPQIGVAIARGAQAFRLAPAARRSSCSTIRRAPRAAWDPRRTCRQPTPKRCRRCRARRTGWRPAGTGRRGRDARGSCPRTAPRPRSCPSCRARNRRRCPTGTRVRRRRAPPSPIPPRSAAARPRSGKRPGRRSSRRRSWAASASAVGAAGSWGGGLQRLAATHAA